LHHKDLNFYSILDLVKLKPGDYSNGGFLLANRWLDIFNDYTNENFNIKDLNDAIENNEGELWDIIEDRFNFFSASTSKLDSDDFGGTKLAAYYTIFEVNMSSGSGLRKKKKLRKILK